MKKNNNANVHWESLGKYIVQCDERNSEDKYTINDVCGISIQKKIIPTKADMNDVSLIPYKIFAPRQFCYVPITSRNGEKITLALNSSEKTHIVSSSYIVFKVNNEEELLPEYLFMIFNRPEFDRYARFNSWGSAREAFSWNEMCRVQIPVPSLSRQKELIAIWQGVREIKEQNEQLAQPLMQMCMSYLQDLKHKYKFVEIGKYIEETNIRNDSNEFGIESLQGVNSDGIFDKSKAKTDDLKFDNYKIVKKGEFAYNPSRINIGSIAMRQENTCIISPMYTVFKVKENLDLIPEFLNIWFRRSEFQRSTWFYATGSVRDTFNFEDMKRSQIPLPPIEIQQAVVNIYNCAKESIQLAKDASNISNKISPALIQKVINE